MKKPEFFLIAFVAVLIDQATKLLVERNIRGNEFLKITNFLHFTNLKNNGSAFGILKDANFAFAILTLIVIIGVILLYDKIPKHWIAQAGYSLILGGAIGNFIDRALFGGVTDFIDFRFWPSFNIADSALTIGIVMIFYYYEIYTKNTRIKSQKKLIS